MAKKITIELTDEQHRRFVNAKLDHSEKSLQSLMIRATDDWLNRAISEGVEPSATSLGNEPDISRPNIAPKSPPVVNVTTGTSQGEKRWARHAREHDLLEWILEKGTGKMAEDITGNLEVFAVAARVLSDSAPKPGPGAGKDTAAEFDRRLDEIEQEYRAGREAAGRNEGRPKPPKKRAS